MIHRSASKIANSVGNSDSLRRRLYDDQTIGHGPHWHRAVADFQCRRPALDKIDLRPIAGAKVFVDTQYLDCTDKNYLLVALHQRLLADRCTLVPKVERFRRGGGNRQRRRRDRSRRFICRHSGNSVAAAVADFDAENCAVRTHQIDGHGENRAGRLRHQVAAAGNQYRLCTGSRRSPELASAGLGRSAIGQRAKRIGRADERIELAGRYRYDAGAATCGIQRGDHFNRQFSLPHRHSCRILTAPLNAVDPLFAPFVRRVSTNLAAEHKLLAAGQSSCETTASAEIADVRLHCKPG